MHLITYIEYSILIISKVTASFSHSVSRVLVFSLIPDYIRVFRGSPRPLLGSVIHQKDSQISEKPLNSWFWLHAAKGHTLKWEEAKVQGEARGSRCRAAAVSSAGAAGVASSPAAAGDGGREVRHWTGSLGPWCPGLSLREVCRHRAPAELTLVT